MVPASPQKHLVATSDRAAPLPRRPHGWRTPTHTEDRTYHAVCEHYKVEFHSRRPGPHKALGKPRSVVVEQRTSFGPREAFLRRDRKIQAPGTISVTETLLLHYVPFEKVPHLAFDPLLNPTLFQVAGILELHPKTVEIVPCPY